MSAEVAAAPASISPTITNGTEIKQHAEESVAPHDDPAVTTPEKEKKLGEAEEVQGKDQVETEAEIQPSCEMNSNAASSVSPEESPEKPSEDISTPPEENDAEETQETGKEEENAADANRTEAAAAEEEEMAAVPVEKEDVESKMDQEVTPEEQEVDQEVTAAEQEVTAEGEPLDEGDSTDTAGIDVTPTTNEPSAPTPKRSHKSSAKKETPAKPAAEPVREGKRRRSAVQRFSSDSYSSPAVKEVTIPEGSGVKLGDISYIDAMISKTQVDDLKKLHSLIFGRIGPSRDVRTNLKKFSGFDFDKESVEYIKKRKLMDQGWVLKYLRTMCDLLGLDKPHRKDELIDTILNFLLSPVDTGKEIPTKHPKRKKSSGSAKKGGRRKSGGASKPKKSAASSGSEEEEEEDEYEAPPPKKTKRTSNDNSAKRRGKPSSKRTVSPKKSPSVG